MTIERNIQEILEDIPRTALAAGKNPSDIGLLLVTKEIEPSRILEAYQSGRRDFGENRVQEFLKKKQVLPQDIRWHLIGRLQTNKVKYVIGETALIHSLDRLDLAAEIERQAGKRAVPQVACLVQINGSREPQKGGVSFEEAESFVREIAAMRRIRLQGLMTVGPLTAGEERVRECFRSVRLLRDRLRLLFPKCGWDVLSMGMSGDYRIAIEEGSTLLRLGSVIFGPRQGQK